MPINIWGSPAGPGPSHSYTFGEKVGVKMGMEWRGLWGRGSRRSKFHSRGRRPPNYRWAKIRFSCVVQRDIARTRMKMRAWSVWNQRQDMLREASTTIICREDRRFTGLNVLVTWSVCLKLFLKVLPDILLSDLFSTLIILRLNDIFFSSFFFSVDSVEIRNRISISNPRICQPTRRDRASRTNCSPESWGRSFDSVRHRRIRNQLWRQE